MSRYGWRPYVPVARRRQRAAKKIEKLRKSGRAVAPIEIDGRKIAKTFWGRAWCDNLEAYSDYENRLPRGRTYVRNGSVIDLQMRGGRISALVSGSEIYEVELEIKPLAAKKWKSIRSQCAGQIDSLVELLQGRISDGVMAIVTRRGEGLFPTPGEIDLDCSCPDWAIMCKHVAAVLYGAGARLDHAPELLFALRGVDAAEMVADAVGRSPTSKRKRGGGRVLAEEDLSSVFGVDIELGEAGAGARADTRARPARRRKRTVASKSSAKKKASRKKASRKNAAAKKKASAKNKVAPKKASRTKKVAGKKVATKKAGTRKAAPKKVAKKVRTKRAGARERAAASKVKASAPKKRPAKRRVTR